MGKSINPLKEEFVKKAIELGACEDQLHLLRDVKTNEDILELFKKNSYWCFKKGLITTEGLLKLFTVKKLNDSHIYTSGINSIVTRGIERINVLSLGNSQNTVESLENSQNTVESLGNSQNTVRSLGNSQNTVESLGNSQNTVESWDNSQIKTDVKGGLIQDRTVKKLYIKKSEYEIILID